MNCTEGSDENRLAVSHEGEVSAEAVGERDGHSADGEQAVILRSHAVNAQGQPMSTR